MLGLSLGWLGVGYVLLGFFAANLIGAVVGIALIATKHMERQSRIPYGVFLALGLCRGSVRRARSSCGRSPTTRI